LSAESVVVEGATSRGPSEQEVGGRLDVWVDFFGTPAALFTDTFSVDELFTDSVYPASGRCVAWAEVGAAVGLLAGERLLVNVFSV